MHQLLTDLQTTGGFGGSYTVQNVPLYADPIAQYVSIKDKGNIGDILQHWPHNEEARIAVVTDGNAAPPQFRRYS